MEACVGDVWYVCMYRSAVSRGERGESEPRYVRLRKLRIDNVDLLYQFNCKVRGSFVGKNSIRPPVFFRLEQKKRI